MNDEWVLDLNKDAGIYRKKIVRDGYLWDDVHDMPVHRYVAMMALGGRFNPHWDVHHIDWHKQHNDPSNLVQLNPIVHEIVHAVASSIWMARRADLRKPKTLIDFLTQAEIPYLWCGNTKEVT